VTAAIVAGALMGASMVCDALIVSRVRGPLGAGLILIWMICSILATWWAGRIGAVPVDAAVAVIVVRASAFVVGFVVAELDLLRAWISPGGDR